jgi:hypothetical protein
MHDLQTTPRVSAPVLSRRDIMRWAVTFVGYPLGGLVAMLVSGRVDSTLPAAFGGALTGAVVGTVQAWGLGRNRPPIAAWIVATAVGFAMGLAMGARLVDFATTPSALVIQGAITGLAVGAAQAIVLLPRLGLTALAWPPTLAAIWALGWVVTTAVGIGVDEQFTVFGSSGALLVTALTLVLPLALNRRER